MNTPSTSRKIQPPTAPQPLTDKEAYQELDQLNIRINHLEGAVDRCLEDIAKCRARLLDLRAQRSDLLTILLLPWALSIDSSVDKISTPAPSISLRETIRRSVCAEPGDYKTHQASAQLSCLHQRGSIGKNGGIYGPPDYCDKTVSGRA